MPPGVYGLSLHDALPICGVRRLENRREGVLPVGLTCRGCPRRRGGRRQFNAVGPERVEHHEGFLQHIGIDLADRKSTRLNSSHRCISYAVFCLKKKTEEK